MTRSREEFEPELAEELLAEILANLEEKRERESYRRYPRRRSAALRRELIGELRALRALKRRLDRPENPEVRKALREILGEAREMGVGLDELLAALSAGSRIPLPERLAGFFPRGNWLFLVLALAALLAVPSVREKVRPALQAVLAQLVALGESLRTLTAKVRESLEDIVAEAQFERLKTSFSETETVPEGPPPPPPPEAGKE